METLSESERAGLGELVGWLRRLRQICRVSAALSIGLALVGPFILWLVPGAVNAIVPELVPWLTSGEVWVPALLGLGFFLLLASGAGVLLASNRLPKRLPEGGRAIQHELRVIAIAAGPALALGLIGVPLFLSIAAFAGPVNLVAAMLFCISAVAVPALAVWIPIRFRQELTQTLGKPFAPDSPAEQEWAEIQKRVVIGVEHL